MSEPSKEYKQFYYSECYYSPLRHKDNTTVVFCNILAKFHKNVIDAHSSSEIMTLGGPHLFNKEKIFHVTSVAIK